MLCGDLFRGFVARNRNLSGTVPSHDATAYNIWMPASSSFDVTSTIDFQEVDNTLNQARKEVAQRYDFKGAKAEINLNPTEKTLTLVADDEFKMNALWEIVQTRLVRRNVPVKNLTWATAQPAANSTMRQVISLQ